jgi:hypothetical protein
LEPKTEFAPQSHEFASNISPEFAAEIQDALAACKQDVGDAVHTIYSRADGDERVAGLLKAWSTQYGLSHVHAERSLLRQIVSDLNDRRVK